MIYLVSGSRNFPHPSFVASTITNLVTAQDTLMHGTARGVDSWCADAARKMGTTVLDRPAQWELHGKSAGFRRNTAMLTECVTQWKKEDIRLLVFWDGQSRGTNHFIIEATLGFRLEPTIFRPSDAKIEATHEREST